MLATPLSTPRVSPTEQAALANLPDRPQPLHVPIEDHAQAKYGESWMRLLRAWMRLLRAWMKMLAG